MNNAKYINKVRTSGKQIFDLKSTSPHKGNLQILVGIILSSSVILKPPTLLCSFVYAGLGHGPDPPPSLPLTPPGRYQAFQSQPRKPNSSSGSGGSGLGSPSRWTRPKHLWRCPSSQRDFRQQKSCRAVYTKSFLLSIDLGIMKKTPIFPPQGCTVGHWL